METIDCNSPDTYVIAVQDYVILQDLEDTVRDFDPKAIVLRATRCDEAKAAIMSQDRLALVFIEAGRRHISEIRLDDEVRDRGGRIVLLGDDAEEELVPGDPESDRWTILARPFSSSNVVALIQSLRS